MDGSMLAQGGPMKRAALYLRVSTIDQHPETQGYDLRKLAEQRGLQVVREYVDHGVSGVRVKRPALDQLMAGARRGEFDVVLVWACDRLARSTKHFLEVLDELNRLNIEFVSFRENLDTGGALGRAVVVIISAIAELERNLIVERVKAGIRRAKMEGRQVGRRPILVDYKGILQDRANGRSLTQIAQAHRISRAMVSKVLRQVGGHETPLQAPPQVLDSTSPESAV